MVNQEKLQKMTDAVFEALKEVLEKEELHLSDYKIESGVTETLAAGVKFKINITLTT